ncbi:MAG: hypothetical protein O8C63_04390 [Candidatus Methanoperedens sp.]|nr:hypothetical protein [Candidatus Methanoperedens sp.]
MAVGLGDIYEKLKELITIMDKVRENTERISKLEEKVDTGFKNMTEEMHGLKEEFRGFREETRLNDSELRGDIKAILNRLDMKEELSALKIQLAEHIAACEKAKA